MFEDQRALSSLIQQVPVLRVRCSRFFVAWNGVLVLAMDGFPDSALELKQKIQETLGDRLSPENSGSKWPKITMGCLKEDQSLTLEEFILLSEICKQASRDVKEITVDIRTISHVEFLCRSLERIRKRVDFDCNSQGIDDSCNPEPVNQVFSEADDVSAYFAQVSLPGSRETHYRSDHGESTLVSFIDVSSLTALLNAFKCKVDAELASKYVWFDDSSLHVTLRAMNLKEA
jgi:hypothetical protein